MHSSWMLCNLCDCSYYKLLLLTFVYQVELIVFIHIAWLIKGIHIHIRRAARGQYTWSIFFDEFLALLCIDVVNASGALEL